MGLLQLNVDGFVRRLHENFVVVQIQNGDVEHLLVDQRNFVGSQVQEAFDVGRQLRTGIVGVVVEEGFRVQCPVLDRQIVGGVDQIVADLGAGTQRPKELRRQLPDFLNGSIRVPVGFGNLEVYAVPEAQLLRIFAADVFRGVSKWLQVDEQGHDGGGHFVGGLLGEDF